MYLSFLRTVRTRRTCRCRPRGPPSARFPTSLGLTSRTARKFSSPLYIFMQVSLSPFSVGHCTSNLSLNFFFTNKILYIPFFTTYVIYSGERFYPCSGPDSFPTPSPDSPPATSAEAAAAPGAGSDRIVNIALTPIGPGPWDRKARAKLTPAQRDLLCKQASAEFRCELYSQTVALYS